MKTKPKARRIFDGEVLPLAQGRLTDNGRTFTGHRNRSQHHLSDENGEPSPRVSRAINVDEYGTIPDVVNSTEKFGYFLNAPDGRELVFFA